MANITRGQGSNINRAGWERRMRDLFEWDPFAQMSPYQGNEMDQFEARFEVKETANAYVFRGDLPGVKEEDLDISLTGNRLTISGKRECEERKEGERFFAYECAYGSFTRAFTLPEGIDTEHATADLKGGVLMVTVPKKPETQPRKISVGQQKAADKSKVKA
jgi:HSP20 family protein